MGWEEWEKEEAANLERIKGLMNVGHTHHCAFRIVWGDGECECNKRPEKRIIQRQCPVCGVVFSEMTLKEVEI